MKKKHNEGFSLVETLVSIAVLALIVIPTCSGIVMGYRMNAKADELMKAQLAVSSAVETLMAEGIKKADEQYDFVDGVDQYPSVSIKTETVKINEVEQPYYKVTVTSTIEGATDVSVITHIRAVTPEGGTG